MRKYLNLKTLVTKLSTLTVLILISNDTALAQSASNEVPCVTADEIELNTDAIKPFRVKLKEYYYNSGNQSLSGYIYYQVDKTHMFTKPAFVIDWSRVSWVATGEDKIITDQYLGVRSRIFPGTAGRIIESHGADTGINILFTSSNPEKNTFTDQTNKKNIHLTMQLNTLNLMQ